MAFIDANLQLSTAQNVTAPATSTLVYDVTGAGVGNAPKMIFGQDALGNPLLPGVDIAGGVSGQSQPCAVFDVTTTGTGTGTVAFGVEAAVDNGSNAEGTYIRLATTGAVVGTALIAGDHIVLQIPPEVIKQLGEKKPRFYRLAYDQTGDGAVHVNGTIQINPDTSAMGSIYGNNFVAA